jgi:hypothetical protein
MKAHGYQQSRRAGSPRFGTKSDSFDYTKVTEYTLSPEELKQYQKGGSAMSKFHKEEYLAFKDQGKTDAEIQKIWKIDYNKMQKLKKQWDIVTKPGRPAAQKKEDVPSVSVSPAEPVMPKIEPAVDVVNYEARINEINFSRDNLARKLREQGVANDELDKENVRLMKALSDQSKALVEAEDELNRVRDDLEKVQKSCGRLEKALNEKDDIILAREAEIDQLLKKLDAASKKPMPNIEVLVGDYEVAVHERDALLTTVKVLAKLSS